MAALPLVALLLAVLLLEVLALLRLVLGLGRLLLLVLGLIQPVRLGCLLLALLLVHLFRSVELEICGENRKLCTGLNIRAWDEIYYIPDNIHARCVIKQVLK